MNEEHKRLLAKGVYILNELKKTIPLEQWLALDGFMHEFDTFGRKAIAQEKAKTEHVVKGKHHADSQLMAAMTQVRTHTHTQNTL